MSRKLSLCAIILCLLFSFVSVSPASAGSLDYDKSQIKPTEMQAKDTGSFWDFLPFDFGDGLKDTLKKIEKFFKPVIKALGDAIDWAAKGIEGLADWWESLDDWTKDLIYTILAVLAVVVVAVAAFFLLPFVGVALLIGAIIGAIVAGAFYFWKYGGTDAFGWGVLAWVFGGAALGALGAWLYSIGAVGAMAGMLRAGLARGLTAALNGMRTFGGWLGQGMRYVGRGMRTFGGWLGQGARRFGGFIARSFTRGRAFVRSAISPRLAALYGSWKNVAGLFGLGAFISVLNDTIFSSEPVPLSEMITNAMLNGSLAAIGFPAANAVKQAWVARNFLSLTKWTAFGGFLGGTANSITEFVKTGQVTFTDIAIGVGVGVVSAPMALVFSGLGNIGSEFANQKAGSLITNRAKDIFYWNNEAKHPLKDNWLKNQYNKGLENFSRFQDYIKNLYKYHG